MSNFDPCDASLDDETERANEFIDVPEESKSYVRYVNVTWLFFTFLLYLYCEISLNIEGFILQIWPLILLFETQNKRSGLISVKKCIQL